jgi:hypothetical protein
VLSILAAIMTAPINLLVDGLFEVISAPTLDQVKLQRQQQQALDAVVAVGRRVSSAARRMSAAVVSRVQAVALPVADRKKNFSKRSSALMENFVTQDISRDVSVDVQQAHALAKQVCGHSLKTREMLSVGSDDFPVGRESASLAAGSEKQEVDIKRRMRSRIAQRQSSVTGRQTDSADPPQSVGSPMPVSVVESAGYSNSSDVGISEIEVLSDFDLLVLEMREHYATLSNESQRKAFCDTWR